jgi:SagB-type dehydrogenase family enzyme
MIAHDGEQSIALDELYHCNSKHSPVRLGFVSAREARRRDRLLHALYEEGKAKFRTYASTSRIELPRQSFELTMSVDGAIRTRRSHRAFARGPVSLATLGTILQRSYGTHEQRDGTIVRAVPSGGGLYPLDVYVLQFSGGELPEGVYHYHAGEHALQRVSPRCDRRELQGASIYPDIVASAAMLLALVADMPRTRAKYGERAYRLALLEAGHVSQNIYLVVRALELGVVALDGFYDDRVHAILDVDGVAQIALVLFAVGHLDV